MVVVNKIYLHVGESFPYFNSQLQLVQSTTTVSYQMEDHKLFIDRIKTGEDGNPIMVESPTEEESCFLMEAVPFDKEVKGILKMDFCLDMAKGTVSSEVLEHPKGTDGVAGYNVTTSIPNFNRSRPTSDGSDAATTIERVNRQHTRVNIPKSELTYNAMFNNMKKFLNPRRTNSNG